MAEITPGSLGGVQSRQEGCTINAFPFGVLITSESFLVDSCLFRRNTILHLVRDSFLLDVQVFLNNRPEPKNPCLDFFHRKRIYSSLINNTFLFSGLLLKDNRDFGILRKSSASIENPYGHLTAHHDYQLDFRAPICHLGFNFRRKRGKKRP